MAVVVVGGSGKDVGKTVLVCTVISALREFEWTAVKITAHDYGSPEDGASGADLVIREEAHAGELTDTERYLAAGARRALLVTRVGSDIPINELRHSLGSDRNVIFESNRIVDAVKPDVCLALVGGQDRKASFERLLRVADAVVVVDGASLNGLPDTVPRFAVESAARLSADLVAWLRQRLKKSADQSPLRGLAI